MADNQKYYYMKIKEDFFDSEDMKLLESMDNGYLYSNILLKLYLLALKKGGHLLYKERIPYSVKMLATLTRHNADVVEKAIEIFRELKLVEILDNGSIFMMDMQALIGKASTEAERKAEYRAKIAAARDSAGTSIGQIEGQSVGQCPDNAGQVSGQTAGQCGDNIDQLSGQATGQCLPEIRDKRLDIFLSEIPAESPDMKNSKKIFPPESIPYRLSALLGKYISQNAPKRKPVSERELQGWAKDIDLLIRIDQAVADDVARVIAFCQKDTFWHKNVLSGFSLRKNYNKLLLLAEG